MPKDEAPEDVAAQRVTDQERRVERQRRRIQQLESEGRLATAERALLEVMEDSLGILRASLPLISN
jgi:hypothetical protein